MRKRKDTFNGISSFSPGKMNGHSNPLKVISGVRLIATPANPRDLSRRSAYSVASWVSIHPQLPLMEPGKALELSLTLGSAEDST